MGPCFQLVVHGVPVFQDDVEVYGPGAVDGVACTVADRPQRFVIVPKQVPLVREMLQQGGREMSRESIEERQTDRTCPGNAT